MKEKKSIDRLFQEKFKEFEASPKNRVWKNIETELQQKEEKKVFPIWWYRIAGIAAVVAVAFFAGNFLWNNAQKQEVVNSPVIIQPEDIQNTDHPFTNKFPSEETKNEENNPSADLNNSVTASKENNVFQKNQTQTPNPEESSQQQADIVYPDSKANSKRVAGNNPTVDKSAPSNGKEFASTGNNSGKNNRAAALNSEEKQNERINVEGSSMVLIRNSSEENKTNKNNSGNIVEKNSEVNKGIAGAEIEASNEVISENEEILNSALKEDKEKSLVEEAAKIKEETSDEYEDEQEQKLSKWLISPNVSPIYYGSLNGGNGIDQSLAENSSSGEVSMAYGVNFAYAISEKLKVRSGVSKVNMSYNVNDIAYSSDVNAIQLEGVRNNPQHKTLEVVSRFSNNQPESGAGGEFGRAVLAPRTEGTLNQQLGYIEVPLELEYALLNKRFGVNIIGGASTLILEENNIGINSEEGYLSIGEANNLNNVSFTTNLGLGFGYSLSKKFDLNLEPTFKYQLNTYNNNINDFKPYYFGVYTGFSFKF